MSPHGVQASSAAEPEFGCKLSYHGVRKRAEGVGALARQVEGWTVRRRYRYMLKTLARHGLGYSVARIGLSGLIPFHRGLLGHPHQDAPFTQPQHLRLALQELGTAYIKLGQILSTRADLLPPEYIAELSRLQSEVPPVPFAALAEVMAEEMGPDFRERYDQLDESPLAAASIGQVHRARLKSGEEVVVKVQRPGVREEVAVDLIILRRLFRRAARTNIGRVVDLDGLFDEFALTLERELDYEEEGRNTDRFRKNLADIPGVYIPGVHWELITPRVLTMDLARGARIDDLAQLDRWGVDRHGLAVRSARVYLKMIFEDGFFHADPHPGNFFIQPDGTLVLIDFGMVGSFNETNRAQLVSLLLAMVRQDPEALIDSVLDLGAGLTAIERQEVTRDVQRLITRYADRALAGISMEGLMNDIFRIAYRHRLRLPANLSLLTKTLAMSEGLARRLDPEFRTMDVLTPYTRQLLYHEYGPRGLIRRLPALAAEMADAAPRLPGSLFRILRRAERGDLAFGLEAHQFADLTGAIRSAGNRLAAGFLAGALLVSMSLLVIAYRGEPGSLIGWLVRGGFAAALGLTLWWLRSVLRGSS